MSLFRCSNVSESYGNNSNNLSQFSYFLVQQGDEANLACFLPSSWDWFVLQEALVFGKWQVEATVQGPRAHWYWAVHCFEDLKRSIQSQKITLSLFKEKIYHEVTLTLFNSNLEVQEFINFFHFYICMYFFLY